MLDHIRPIKLDGEVPKTIISGKTANINQFCELGWYEWVKFRSTAVSFPEDPLVLGKYLCPSIDVGPTMTASNRQGSTPQHLQTADA